MSRRGIAVALLGAVCAHVASCLYSVNDVVTCSRAREPILHFPFDEGSGGVVDDVSGKFQGVPSTPSGSFSWIADGVSGGALHVPDTAGGAVLVGHHSALDPPALTVALWIRRTGESEYQTLVQKLAKEDTDGYALAINKFGSPTWFTISGETASSISSKEVLTVNEWHHLAGTFSNANGLALYLDGRRVEKLAGAKKSASEAPLYIGVEDGDESPFLGDIDDVRIYDVELCGSEIAALARIADAGGY